MVAKVNGAAYPGIWVEKKVAFIKVTFSTRVDQVAAANLFLAGTTTVATGAVGNSAFGVVESAVVQALKLIGSKATILGVSPLGTTGTTMDVMVGHAEGFFANASDQIVGADGTTQLGAVAVLGAKAIATTAGTGAPIGTLLDVNPAGITMTLSFAYMNGTMAAATVANGGVVFGPGASSGAFPTTTAGSSTGVGGYYPVTVVGGTGGI